MTYDCSHLAELSQMHTVVLNTDAGHHLTVVNVGNALVVKMDDGLPQVVRSHQTVEVDGNNLRVH